MREVLELSLSKWRRIAMRSENQELKDFLNQFCDLGGDEPFLLHPANRIRRDTGEMQAVAVRPTTYEARSLERILANMDGWSDPDE